MGVMSSKSVLGLRIVINLEGHILEIETLGMKKWSPGCYTILSKLEWVLKCPKVEIERMA